MNSTEYRKRLLLDIPTQDKQLITYECGSCFQSFNTISVLFGRPTKPDCPLCPGTLKIRGRKRLPFYSPKGDEYFLKSGMLNPITDDAFQSVVAPLLAVPKKSSPLFLRSLRSDGEVIHIIRLFDGLTPSTFCHLSINNLRRWRICSGLTEVIPLPQLCVTCHDEAIAAFKNHAYLNPLYRINKLSKQKRYQKLFRDALSLGNVKLACELNDVSRPTYYNARKTFTHIYNQIIT